MQIFKNFSETSKSFHIFFTIFFFFLRCALAIPARESDPTGPPGKTFVLFARLARALLRALDSSNPLKFGGQRCHFCISRIKGLNQGMEKPDSHSGKSVDFII